MHETLYFITAVGFLIWIARNCVYWGIVLDDHGYSFRKVVRFLTAPSSGRNQPFSVLSLLKWGLIVLYPLIIFYENFTLPYHMIIAGIYITELFRVITELRSRRKLFSRFFSMKSFLLIVGSLFFGIVLFLFPPLDRFLWLLLIDRFIVAWMFLLLIFSAIPEGLFFDYRAVNAAEKVRKRNDLTTILILGGQDSTLMHSLMRVIFPEDKSLYCLGEGSVMRSVEQIILRKLQPKHTYLICFLRPTSRENIRQMREFLQPTYVIVHDLAGLSHCSPQDFLGSGKKSEAATYLLLNKDDTVIREVFSKKRKRYYFYGAFHRKGNDLWITEQEILREKTTGTFFINDSAIPVSTNHVSEKVLQLLLPIVSVAHELGIVSNEKTKKMSTFTTDSNILQYRDVDRTGILTYSIAESLRDLPLFMSYLTLFTAKKLLVLDGNLLTQLKTQRDHIRFYTTFLQEFDFIFLTSTSTANKLLQSVRGVKSKNFIAVASHQE